MMDFICTKMSLRVKMKKVGFLYFLSIYDRGIDALSSPISIPTVSFKKQTPSQKFLSENKKIVIKKNDDIQNLNKIRLYESRM